MNEMQDSKFSLSKTLFRVLQGALIGLGAVLPGISGGVLSVIFGIYKPIMELLSNPFANFKTHVPKLLPVFIGGGIGFLGSPMCCHFSWKNTRRRRVPLHRSDHRHASVPVSRGGRAGKKQSVLCVHDCVHVRDLCTSHRT